MKKLEIDLFFGLVSSLLFASIFGWNYRQLELLKQGLRIEGIAKTMFSQTSFIGDTRVEFWFFGSLGSRFSEFFLPWKQA